jgi:hypothetical protein
VEFLYRIFLSWSQSHSFDYRPEYLGIDAEVFFDLRRLMCGIWGPLNLLGSWDESKKSQYWQLSITDEYCSIIVIREL